MVEHAIVAATQQAACTDISLLQRQSSVIPMLSADMETWRKTALSWAVDPLQPVGGELLAT
jgi:hypothetical protein